MRPTWDEYFIDLAKKVSKRATCDRAQVGCVLVKDKQTISTGYNGSISGTPHCDTVGHDIVNNHCERAVHAEQNAITMAAKHGISTNNAIAYVTHYPCWLCFKLLIQCGVKRIVYHKVYKPDERVIEASKNLNIAMEQV